MPDALSTLERSQQLLWTAIPRGQFAADKLHVVAYASPRLTTHDTIHGTAPDSVLSAFPDFVDWPSVAPTAFTVELEGTPYRAEVVDGFDRSLSSEVWRGVFSTVGTAPGALVRSFVPAEESFGTARVRSSSATDLAAFARYVYTAALGEDEATATQLPAVQRLIGLIGRVAFHDLPRGIEAPAVSSRSDRQAIIAAIDGRLAADRSLPPGFVGSPLGRAATAFIEHELFLTSYTPNLAHPTPTERPVRDFHEYLSILGHHRTLLRLLCLAFDLVVDLASATTDSTAPPDPCREWCARRGRRPQAPSRRGRTSSPRPSPA